MSIVSRPMCAGGGSIKVNGFDTHTAETNRQPRVNETVSTELSKVTNRGTSIVLTVCQSNDNNNRILGGNLYD